MVEHADPKPGNEPPHHEIVEPVVRDVAALDRGAKTLAREQIRARGLRRGARARLELTGVETRDDRGHDAALRNGEVGAHDAVESPILERAQRVAIFASVRTVDARERAHHGAGLALFDRGPKGREIDLAQRTLGHDLVDREREPRRIVAEPSLLLRVRGEVLDHRNHVTRLNRRHLAGDDARGKVRVLAEALGRTSKVPSARQVHRGTEHLVAPRSKEFAAYGEPVTFGEVGVEARSQRERRRPCGAAVDTRRAVGAATSP